MLHLRLPAAWHVLPTHHIDDVSKTSVGCFRKGRWLESIRCQDQLDSLGEVESKRNSKITSADRIAIVTRVTSSPGEPEEIRLAKECCSRYSLLDFDLNRLRFGHWPLW